MDTLVEEQSLPFRYFASTWSSHADSTALGTSLLGALNPMRRGQSSKDPRASSRYERNVSVRCESVSKGALQRRLRKNLRVPVHPLSQLKCKASLCDITNMRVQLTSHSTHDLSLKLEDGVLHHYSISTHTHDVCSRHRRLQAQSTLVNKKATCRLLTFNAFGRYLVVDGSHIFQPSIPQSATNRGDGKDIGE